MGILNRFFLMLASLALLAIALAVLTVSLRLLPQSYWLNELNFLLGRPETIAVSVIALLIALQLFFASFSRDKRPSESTRGEFVMVSGANGEVRVSLSAIRELVDRLVREVRGIRDVQVKVSTVKDKKAVQPLKVALSLVIGQDANVKDVSAAAVANVQQQLVKVMGFAEVPVSVDVAAISNAAPDRKRRVV